MAAGFLVGFVGYVAVECELSADPLDLEPDRRLERSLVVRPECADALVDQPPDRLGAPP